MYHNKYGFSASTGTYDHLYFISQDHQINKQIPITDRGMMIVNGLWIKKFLIIYRQNTQICIWIYLQCYLYFNAKLPSYVSRHPEPNTVATDAFSLTWDDNLLYISTFQLDTPNPSENRGSQSQCHNHSTNLANPGMVAKSCSPYLEKLLPTPTERTYFI